MAGAKTSSKNARAGASKNARPANYGETKFLISCNGGKNAYVLDPATSQNPNLPTDSDNFAAAVSALVAAGHGPKIRAEIDGLADASDQWATVKDKLVADGILV